MEEAVNFRMETMSKKKGGVLQTMLKSGSISSEFFDVAEKRNKPSSITRLLDV